MTRLPLLISLLLPVSLQAAGAGRGTDLPVFTTKDMYVLAEKIGKSLGKCRLLSSRPNVSVEVENKTGELVDKTRFSQLIHSHIEWKTHNVPETNPPEFDVRATLEANAEHEGGTQARLIYTLTAQVLQAEEKLCEKKASITKRITLRPRSSNPTP